MFYNLPIYITKKTQNLFPVSNFNNSDDDTYFFLKRKLPLFSKWKKINSSKQKLNILNIHILPLF